MVLPARSMLLTIRKILPEFACFYICYYFYFLFAIETNLLYQAFGRLIKFPEFSTGSSFLFAHLSQPGGLLEYTAGFLSHCYYYPWLGALIITIIAICFSICLLIMFRFRQTILGTIACFVPAVLMLIPFNRYDHQLPAMLSILLAVIALTIYISIPIKEPFRVIIWLVIFVCLYYVASGTCFFFAAMTVIYEISSRRRILTTLVYLLISAGTYTAGVLIFDHKAEIVFLRDISAQAVSEDWIKVSIWGIYISFLIILAYIGFADRFKKNDGSSRKRKKDKTHKSTNILQGGILKTTLCTMTVIAASAILCHYSFNKRMKNELQISYFASHRMWDDLLQEAKTLEINEYNIFINHDVNRALYHTDHLCDDMFKFPQRLAALILSESKGSFSANTFDKRCELFLDLGHMGMARRLDHEALEVSGSSPYVLKRLALIDLTKGQIEAAKLILSSLSNDMIFGSWADNYLSELEKDPDQTGNDLIMQMRSVMSAKDNVNMALQADDFFVQLLAKNPKNKMAFEYMMAYYLMTRQVNKISAGLGGMRDLGYEKIPQHLEEAIAIFLLSGGKLENYYGYTISNATLSRIKTFNNLFVQYGGKRNRELAMGKLEQNYLGSYTFYFAFGTSGVVK